MVGLVALLSVWALPALVGTSQSAALQSAQATLANLVAVTRTKALASGGSARLLVNIDPASPLAEGRYLRYLVMQVQNGAGWETAGDAWLPDGVCLVPRDPTAPPNLLAPGAPWTRPSDSSSLRSTAQRAAGPGFSDAEVTLAINSGNVELWAAIKFTAIGTTANSGDLVVASCRALPPGGFAAGGPSETG